LDVRTLIVRIFDAEDEGRSEGLRGVVEQVGGPDPDRRLFDGSHALLASIQELAASPTGATSPARAQAGAAERSTAEDPRG
jgi:hypothetical protein